MAAAKTRGGSNAATAASAAGRAAGGTAGGGGGAAPEDCGAAGEGRPSRRRAPVAEVGTKAVAVGGRTTAPANVAAAAPTWKGRQQQQPQQQGKKKPVLQGAEEKRGELRMRRVDANAANRSCGLTRDTRATVQQVLDNRSCALLQKLLQRHAISGLCGTISTGKEGNVYFAAAPPARPAPDSNSTTSACNAADTSPDSSDAKEPGGSSGDSAEGSSSNDRAEGSSSNSGDVEDSSSSDSAEGSSSSGSAEGSSGRSPDQDCNSRSIASGSTCGGSGGGGERRRRSGSRSCWSGSSSNAGDSVVAEGKARASIPPAARTSCSTRAACGSNVNSPRPCRSSRTSVPPPRCSWRPYAVKIFRTSILTFQDRSRYIEGDYRFERAYTRCRNPRKMAEAWCLKEFRNLRRLHANGVPAPFPTDVARHVLLFDFLGYAADKTPAASRLQQQEEEQQEQQQAEEEQREQRQRGKQERHVCGRRGHYQQQQRSEEQRPQQQQAAAEAEEEEEEQQQDAEELAEDARGEGRRAAAGFVRVFHVTAGDGGDTPGLAYIPAPRLKDLGCGSTCCCPAAAAAAVAVWNCLYVQAVAVTRWLFQQCHMVHGDLSEYNLLYVHPKSLFVIDVGQAVERDHPQALEFLKRDCKNLTAFFEQQLAQAAKRLRLVVEQQPRGGQQEQQAQGEKQPQRHEQWRQLEQQERGWQQHQEQDQEHGPQQQEEEGEDQEHGQEQERKKQQEKPEQREGQHTEKEQQQGGGGKTEMVTERWQQGEKMTSESACAEGEPFAVGTAAAGEDLADRFCVGQQRHGPCACVYSAARRSCDYQQQWEMKCRAEEKQTAKQHQQPVGTQHTSYREEKQQQQRFWDDNSGQRTAGMESRRIFAWPETTEDQRMCACKRGGVQPHSPLPVLFPPVPPQAAAAPSPCCCSSDNACEVSGISSSSSELLVAASAAAITPWSARDLFQFVVSPVLPACVENILAALVKADDRARQQKQLQQAAALDMTPRNVCSSDGNASNTCVGSSSSSDGGSSSSSSGSSSCCGAGGETPSSTRANARGRKGGKGAAGDAAAAAAASAAAEKCRLEYQRQLALLAEALGIYFVTQHDKQAETSAAGAAAPHTAAAAPQTAAAAAEAVSLAGGGRRRSSSCSVGGATKCTRDNRRESNADEEDSAADDEELFMRSWIPTRLSQLCPLQLLSKIPQQPDIFLQQQRSAKLATEGCGSSSRGKEIRGPAAPERKVGEKDALDELLALHALMQRAAAKNTTEQQEEEEEEEKNEVQAQQVPRQQRKETEQATSQRRRSRSEPAHEVRLLEAQSAGSQNSVEGSRERQVAKRREDEEEVVEEQKHVEGAPAEVEGPTPPTSCCHAGQETLGNGAHVAHVCDGDFNVGTSCSGSESDEEEEAESSDEERAGKEQIQPDTRREEEEGAPLEEEGEAVYVFRGHIPEGVTRKEWKQLVKEQNRERRKYKVPKQLKKKYRAKAANR